MSPEIKKTVIKMQSKDEKAFLFPLKVISYDLFEFKLQELLII